MKTGIGLGFALSFMNVTSGFGATIVDIPAYQPVMLLKILIYAYRAGVYSSRRSPRPPGDRGVPGTIRQSVSRLLHNQRLSKALSRIQGSSPSGVIDILRIRQGQAGHLWRSVEHIFQVERHHHVGAEQVNEGQHGRKTGCRKMNCCDIGRNRSVDSAATRSLSPNAASSSTANTRPVTVLADEKREADGV